MAEISWKGCGLNVSEKRKHRCAVRQFLAWRNQLGLQKFRDFCHGEKIYPIWLKVQDDFVVQWRLGNRGEWGKWI